MKTLLRTASVHAFAGLLVILPITILLFVGWEVYDLLEETAVFARLDLPFPGFINALIYIFLILVVVFLICLVVGLLLKTAPGKIFSEFIENTVSEKIPLLGLVRNLTINLTGQNNKNLIPVEADLQGNGSAVLAILMETLDDGRLVIFVPGAPAVTLGTVHLVPAERVKSLPSSTASLAGVISQWGVGTRELMKKQS